VRVKTITIRPDGDSFRVTISSPSKDIYEDVPRLPSALGNYHFDCDKYSDNEAEWDLLICMIARHDEEINRLQKSKAALVGLRERNCCKELP
jgi:hypothetical protein